MFHLGLLCLLCPITVLLSFRFIDTFIPMDTYTNKWCMIGSVHISTIVHPLARTSSLSVFSVFSGVLQNIFVNSVNSVTPKFGTPRSWGGTTHKLKPSPFHQLRFSEPTPCSVLPLNRPLQCSGCFPTSYEQYILRSPRYMLSLILIFYFIFVLFLFLFFLDILSWTLHPELFSLHTLGYNIYPIPLSLTFYHI